MKKNNNKKILINFAIVTFLFSTSLFAVNNAELKPNTDYTQAIQIVNLLANANIPDPGMTPTAIMVKYYNGTQNPCWAATLNYQDDYTIHSGPTQGCLNKVNEIVITPIDVLGKLKNYQGPLTVSIDATKYANQITIVQDKAPLFSPQNGLVTSSGTFKAIVQAQLAS